MANSDSSQYVLRYNEITGALEYGSGNNWTPAILNSGTVSSINSLTGAVTLAAGSNITITPSGNTLTIASTGGGGSPNVVQGTDTTSFTSNSNSYLGTGTNVTITPSSNTAKILIMVSSTLTSADPTATSAEATIFGTANGNLGGGIGVALISTSANTTDQTDYPCTMTVLDSPGTTAPQTYQVQIASTDGVTNVTWNRAGAQATIVAQEIH